MNNYLYKVQGIGNKIMVIKIDENDKKTIFALGRNSTKLKTKLRVPSIDYTIDEYLSRGFKFADKEKIDKIVTKVIITRNKHNLEKELSKINRANKKIDMAKSRIDNIINQNKLLPIPSNI